MRASEPRADSRGVRLERFVRGFAAGPQTFAMDLEDLRRPWLHSGRHGEPDDDSEGRRRQRHQHTSVTAR
jgi:hypothetical protein